MTKLRVLVVEDEAIISIDLQGQLEDLGYQVVGDAFTGSDALDLAAQMHPDLVLMDINLRGKMDGVQAALRLNEEYAIPVIFVTASVDNETIQRTKQCKPYGYITKPVRHEDLYTTIEHAVYRRTTEGQLRESEALFRGLFDTSIDGIIATDLSGVIQTANPAVGAMLGCSPDSLAGLRFDSYFPPEYLAQPQPAGDDPEAVLQAWEDLIRELRLPDGSVLPVHIKVWLRTGPDGQPSGYWGIIHDMTQLRASEERILRQAERAQSLVDLTALLNRQMSLADLYQTVSTEMLLRMDVDAVAFSLLDPETSKLNYAYWRGPRGGGFKLAIKPYPEEFHQHFSTPGSGYLYFENVQDEPMLANRALWVQLDVRSGLALNLVFESRVIGSLILVSVGRLRRFTKDEIHFLLAFANQVAVALDRAQLYEQTRTRIHELEVIGRLTKTLRSVSKPEDMMPILLDSAVNLTGADCGTIYLLGQAGNVLQQVESSTAATVQTPQLIDGAIWARALAAEDMIILSSDPNDPNFVPISSPSDPPVQTVLLLPLRSLDTVSALAALGFLAPRRFSAGEKKVLASLAEMGASALHRSGLLDMLEKRASERSNELRTLYNLSLLFSSTMSYGDKVETALSTAVNTLSASSGAIYCYHAGENTLSLVVQHNLPLPVLAHAYELTIGPEMKSWLETSTVPWLVNRGDHLTPPLGIGHDAGYGTVINLPIRFEGDTLGLMTLLWQDVSILSPDNIALLISIAYRIGDLVHNEAVRKDSETAALREERQRLARELHDSVTQTIYGLALLAEAGKDLLAGRNLEALQGCLQDLEENSIHALKEMRMLLFELRETTLEERDLAQALKLRLDAVERRCGVGVNLQVNGSLALSSRQKEGLYRVAVEALNNSLKHSGARSLQVELTGTEDKLTMTIVDDGSGFDLAGASSAGMGLTGMKERVSQLGGRLEIQTAPGAGTCVMVELLLEATHE